MKTVLDKLSKGSISIVQLKDLVLSTTMKAILLHLTLFIFLFGTLLHFGIFTTVPNNQNLLNWDANWYYQIMSNGYQFIPDTQCNLAFFPLFPYFWKVLNLSPIGISILNTLIFFISFFFLVKNKSLTVLQLLFLMSIPSLIFMGVPYSESLFFAFSVLLLKGYEKNNTLNKLIAFFFLSLIRSVALLFIPAIVIVELLTNRHEKIRVRLKRLFSLLLACITGVAVTCIIQFIQTGKWLYFITVQQYWLREWQIPHFPLTTNMPHRVLALDGIAFVIGLLALFCLFYWFYDIVYRKKRIGEEPTEMQPTLVFSCLYLLGTTLLDTLYTQKFNGSTSIWSLNRHLLSTPFAIVFMIYLIKDFDLKKYRFFFYGFIPLAGVVLTGVYDYKISAYYIFFFIITAVLRFFSRLKYIIILFYVFSLYLQLMFYHDFLIFMWMG